MREKWSNWTLSFFASILIPAVILLAIGIPPYLEGRRHKQNKDTILGQSLWVIRRSIEFYSQGLKRPPKTLQDLVDAKYLREMPVDPFTGSSGTWVLESGARASEQSTTVGIIDVHSGASGADATGKPYNQY